MPNNTSGFNFAELVQASRDIPEMSQGSPGVSHELPPSIKPARKNTTYVNPNIPEGQLGVELFVTHHSRVFTIWRPWETCDRCKNLLETGHMDLSPTTGDWECPHTQRDEYKAVMDRGLKGHYAISLKEVFTLMNGVRCVHVEWLEPDEKQLRLQERLQKEKEQNRVYPPDVAAAFSNK